MVALGTDYNILMIARLREQAKEGMEPREAAAVALQHAGPTIGAAGLILAGTFASLTLAGNTTFLSSDPQCPAGSCWPHSSWLCFSRPVSPRL